MAEAVDRKELTRLVTDVYAQVAQEPGAGYHFEVGRGVAAKLGYPDELLDKVPQRAVDSFAGVGYYFDLAALQPGQSVLDLGSGSGMDSFMAAVQVGPTGVVVGVDITPEQLEQANQLRSEAFSNVSFQNAQIDALPFEDNRFDVAISNGVLNLLPDKAKGFAEIARVLKPRGKLALADIVTEKQLIEGIVCDATLWASCIGGAMQEGRYTSAIEDTGMRVVTVRENPQYQFLSESAQEASVEFGVKSVSLLAEKR